MSEYDANRQNAPQVGQNVQLATETIDVFIRNLELAKAQLESATESDHPTWCTLLYGEPGTFCPLFYIHTVAEADSTES
jgi:hypothetical protein